MKKVLFISSFIGQPDSGGAIASQRNLQLCKMLFPDHKIEAYGFAFPGTKPIKDVNLLPSYIGRFNTLMNYVLGYTGGLTYSNFKTIRALFNQYQYSHVFLDGSLLGKVVTYIRENSITTKIILFCHNVERDFFKAAASTNKLFYILFLKAWKAEKIAVKTANFFFVFNQRDAVRMIELYKVHATGIIPLTIPDRFIVSKVKNDTNHRLQLLFIGSRFYANIEGIRWFCKHVMANLQAELLIAGNGMEILASELSSANVKVLGRVDDIDALYYGVNAVVIPVFSGSGMKVKTAEALMFGKTIIGADEAWEGYDFDKSGGYRCNTPEEFLSAIDKVNERGKLVYNESARQLYIDHYSDEFLQRQLNEIKLKIQL